jgi:hypothetical protein
MREGSYGAPMVEEDVPAAVEDLALGAFRLVKEKLAFELDFTPETLPVLDHFLRSLRDPDPSDTVVSLAGPCAGAYFGEVVRRSLPGLRWHCPSDDYRRWRLEGVNVFVALNPIGAALEAIYGEAVADFHAHLALLPEEQSIVEASLAHAGPVREDDFYRLAVRHEVLEQTLSVLGELAHRKGERRTFGPEVYAAALDARSGVIDA